MQLGHSKDHRPDLAQFKLMAAVAEPTGLFLAGDVHPGNAADDPLYLPLYRRVRALLGQTGLLYAGDCKMAALETRAEIAANAGLLPDPAPPDRSGPGPVRGLGRGGPRRRAGREADRDPRARTNSSACGYEFERSQSAVVGQTEHTWTERVQVIRSEASAQSQAAALDRRLKKAEAAVRGLTPPPGPGRTQFTTGWELERAVAAVLAEHEVAGAVDGEPGSARDQPDQVRGARPRRPEPPQDDRMERPLSDHVGAARRARRSNGGWRGWAGRCR